MSIFWEIVQRKYSSFLTVLRLSIYVFKMITSKSHSKADIDIKILVHVKMNYEGILNCGLRIKRIIFMKEEKEKRNKKKNNKKKNESHESPTSFLFWAYRKTENTFEIVLKNTTDLLLFFLHKNRLCKTQSQTHRFLDLKNYRNAFEFSVSKLWTNARLILKEKENTIASLIAKICFYRY